MIRIITLCVIVCNLSLLTHTTKAQKVDYKKIILPPDANATDFGERLVQLAWENYPDNSLIQYDIELAETNVKKVRWEWLNLIRATGNLNEFSFNESLAEEANAFFPRYNFSLSLPVGTFIQTPTNVKIARLEEEKTKQLLNKQKLFIRKEVLAAYQNYLLYQNIFKIKSDLTEDEYSGFLAMEEKFENGEVTLEEYKQASRSYNLELESKLMASNRLEQAKLEIEMWIGVKLEDVN